MLELMIDRPDAQLALQAFKGRLDLRELHVAIPQHCGILSDQVGAQQIVTVSQLRLFELGVVGVKRKCLRRDLFVFSGHANLHESERAARLLLGGSEAQQQLIPFGQTLTHPPQLAQ